MASPTLLASFRAEGLKLRKRPAARMLAGAWFVMMLNFAYVLPYFSRDSGAAGGGPLSATLPANLVANAVGGFAFMGGAIAMILGALVAGHDRINRVTADRVAEYS